MNKIILILALITLVFSQTILKIDLTKSTIIPKEKLYRAHIVSVGGSKPYIYTFSELPSKWLHIGEFVFIPQDDILVRKKYIVRLSVKDSSLQ